MFCVSAVQPPVNMFKINFQYKKMRKFRKKNGQRITKNSCYLSHFHFRFFVFFFFSVKSINSTFFDLNWFLRFSINFCVCHPKWKNVLIINTTLVFIINKSMQSCDKIKKKKKNTCFFPFLFTSPINWIEIDFDTMAKMGEKRDK